MDLLALLRGEIAKQHGEASAVQVAVAAQEAQHISQGDPGDYKQVDKKSHQQTEVAAQRAPAQAATGAAVISQLQSDPGDHKQVDKKSHEQTAADFFNAATDRYADGAAEKLRATHLERGTKLLAEVKDLISAMEAKRAHFDRDGQGPKFEANALETATSKIIEAMRCKGSVLTTTEQGLVFNVLKALVCCRLAAWKSLRLLFEQQEIKSTDFVERERAPFRVFLSHWEYQRYWPASLTYSAGWYPAETEKAPNGFVGLDEKPVTRAELENRARLAGFEPERKTDSNQEIGWFWRTTNTAPPGSNDDGKFEGWTYAFDLNLSNWKCDSGNAYVRRRLWLKPLVRSRNAMPFIAVREHQRHRLFGWSASNWVVDGSAAIGTWPTQGSLGTTSYSQQNAVPLPVHTRAKVPANDEWQRTSINWNDTGDDRYHEWRRHLVVIPAGEDLPGSPKSKFDAPLPIKLKPLLQLRMLPRELLSNAERKQRTPSNAELADSKGERAEGRTKRMALYPLTAEEAQALQDNLGKDLVRGAGSAEDLDGRELFHAVYERRGILRRDVGINELLALARLGGVRPEALPAPSACASSLKLLADSTDLYQTIIAEVERKLTSLCGSVLEMVDSVRTDYFTRGIGVGWYVEALGSYRPFLQALVRVLEPFRQVGLSTFDDYKHWCGFHRVGALTLIIDPLLEERRFLNAKKWWPALAQESKDTTEAASIKILTQNSLPPSPALSPAAVDRPERTLSSSDRTLSGSSSSGSLSRTESEDATLPPDTGLEKLVYLSFFHERRLLHMMRKRVYTIFHRVLRKGWSGRRRDQIVALPETLWRQFAHETLALAFGFFAAFRETEPLGNANLFFQFFIGIAVNSEIIPHGFVHEQLRLGPYIFSRVQSGLAVYYDPAFFSSHCRTDSGPFKSPRLPRLSEPVLCLKTLPDWETTLARCARDLCHSLDESSGREDTEKLWELLDRMIDATPNHEAPAEDDYAAWVEQPWSVAHEQARAVTQTLDNLAFTIYKTYANVFDGLFRGEFPTRLHQLAHEEYVEVNMHCQQATKEMMQKANIACSRDETYLQQFKQANMLNNSIVRPQFHHISRSFFSAQKPTNCTTWADLDAPYIASSLVQVHALLTAADEHTTYIAWMDAERVDSKDAKASLSAIREPQDPKDAKDAKEAKQFEENRKLMPALVQAAVQLYDRFIAHFEHETTLYMVSSTQPFNDDLHTRYYPVMPPMSGSDHGRFVTRFNAGGFWLQPKSPY